MPIMPLIQLPPLNTQRSRGHYGPFIFTTISVPHQSQIDMCPLLDGSLPGTSDDLCSSAASGSLIGSAPVIAHQTSDQTLASSLSDMVSSYKMNTRGGDGH
jgi:hypothetical protein